jgi:hypothetical protein
MKARRTIACVMLAALLLATAGALAQSNGFDLSWFTADGGGGASQGGSFVVAGTIGQPDAGVMTGGPFLLEGGYWTGVGGPISVFLPIVRR